MICFHNKVSKSEKHFFLLCHSLLRPSDIWDILRKKWKKISSRCGFRFYGFFGAFVTDCVALATFSCGNVFHRQRFSDVPSRYLYQLKPHGQIHIHTSILRFRVTKNVPLCSTRSLSEKNRANKGKNWSRSRVNDLI